MPLRLVVVAASRRPSKRPAAAAAAPIKTPDSVECSGEAGEQIARAAICVGMGTSRYPSNVEYREVENEQLE